MPKPQPGVRRRVALRKVRETDAIRVRRRASTNCAADFSNVFVPYIGNTLFRNHSRRVGNGFVFGMGNPLANARTGPYSRDVAGENVSDPLHKRERVGFRVNAAGKLVQLNNSLPVTFVFQLGALHRCLLVRCGTALLWISESQGEY